MMEDRKNIKPVRGPIFRPKVTVMVRNYMSTLSSSQPTVTNKMRERKNIKLMEK